MPASIPDRARALWRTIAAKRDAQRACAGSKQEDAEIARIEAEAVAAIERELRARKGRTE